MLGFRSMLIIPARDVADIKALDCTKSVLG